MRYLKTFEFWPFTNRSCDGRDTEDYRINHKLEVDVYNKKISEGEGNPLFTTIMNILKEENPIL